MNAGLDLFLHKQKSCPPDDGQLKTYESIFRVRDRWAMRFELLPVVAEIADDIAIDLHVVCIVDPVDEFFENITHSRLLLALCNLLAQVGGVKSQNNAGGNSVHNDYLHFMIANYFA